MASRYYRTLEEEALDPRYDEASPFEGAPEPYDTPQESPFDSPPSVEQAKATKPEQKGSPFDEVDPRVKALDEQIASRPRSIGGIIAAFSPHGDRTMANLMAQRHLVGQEVHGDQQLKRQLESSRMMQESAYKRAEAMQAAAEARARAQVGAAGVRGNAQVTTGAGHDTARVEAARIGAGARTGAAQIAADSRDYATDNRQPSAGPRASRAPANPQIPVLQAELKQIAKALNDPNLSATDQQKALLAARYQDRLEKLQQLSGQPAPAPSAAPSTAPSVQQSAAPTISSHGDSGDLGPAASNAQEGQTGTVTLPDGTRARVIVKNGRYIRG